MKEHALFVGYLVLTSTAFALVEIQVEGPNGWASKLPTWKIDNKWTRRFFGSRPLTGYHLYLLLFIMLIVHIPYALGLAQPNVETELRIISFVILFGVVEDFLWFVLNSAFGLHKFRSEHIWWHSDAWWWIMPREYWILGPVGVALYIWSWMS